jgi:hypothetical protein
VDKVVLQPGETRTKHKYPNFKDVKRMNEILVSLLKMVVESLQNHSHRIDALEKEELNEDGDDENLMEELTFLLDKFQTPQSAEPVPSDQM